MKKKPVIGVMPLYDDDKDSLWMVQGYFDGLLDAGAVPLMLPLELDEEGFESIRDEIDGYLFTGGHDLNPKLYGEDPIPEDEAFCDRRDTLETMVFDWCYENDVPALGICRGIQLFNVARGGSLWQDIAGQFQKKGRSTGEERPFPKILHTMDPPYAEHHAEHKVRIEEDSPLFHLLHQKTITVNSYHHQAVKQVGGGLVPMAHAEDGLVEALFAPDKTFLWAVQWHPEFTCRTDNNSRLLFEALVNATH